MQKISLDQFCFHVDDHFGYTDLYHYDDFGLPDEIVIKLDEWADVFWASMEHPESIDLEQYNRIGLELTKEVKPFITHIGKLSFSSIVDIEVLPNGKHLTGKSIEIE